MCVMKSIVFLFLCLGISVPVSIAITKPYLASPGNPAILVFLDLHRSYHGDTCGDPDWGMVELALRLQWKSSQNNKTGLEIYDTCRSSKRVSAILREKLTSSVSCNNSSTATSVAGVISYSTDKVNDAITNLVDAVHIVIRENNADSSVDSTGTEGQIYVDLPSSSNIKVLSSMLKLLNWTYIATVTGNDPVSLSEHEAFLQAAIDNDVCVQYTQIINDWQTETVVGSKTPGIVIFAENLSEIHYVLDQQPDSSVAVIVSHDTSTDSFKYMHRGIVLTDVFDSDSEFSEYMSTKLWNTATNELTMAYYLANYNCSFNQSTQEVTCPEVEEIRARFLTVTSSRRMNVVDDMLDMLLGISTDMLENNCTDYSRKCLNQDMITDNSRIFDRLGNQTLLQTLPVTIMLSHIDGGNIVKANKIPISNMNNIEQPVRTWIGSNSSFPDSKCTSWCPACQEPKCPESSSTKPLFAGEYVYIPGDILIAGLIPMSQKWNKQQTDQVCSGVKTQDNVDILSEAFVYAIQSSKDRYAKLFPNNTIGAILFDTCSDLNRAMQIVISFESCRYDFVAVANEWKPSPYIAPIYVVVEESSAGSDIVTQTADLEKLALGVDTDGSIYDSQGIVYHTKFYDFNAVMSLLNNLNWSYVGLLTSTVPSDVHIDDLFDSARAYNICISYNSKISQNTLDLKSAVNSVQGSVASVVLLFANSEDINSLFMYLTSKIIVKTWIILESRENWSNLKTNILPLGTILLQRQGKQNDGFNTHINNVVQGNAVNYSNVNTWINKYQAARSAENIRSFLPDAMTLAQSSDVIKTVDISLAAVNEAVHALCGNVSMLCPAFLAQGAARVIQNLKNVWFAYQEETIKLANRDETFENYVISNLQATGLAEVGRWADGHLILSKGRIKSYNSAHEELPTLRESRCFTGQQCTCSNVSTINNDNGTSEKQALDPEMGFADSTAEFETDLWKIIVVIISGSGGFMTLILFLYILCKVCGGSVMRKYLILGIPMLFAMLCLFLSVLPFVFTPSEEVCGMRYFAHGFSYALCFASLLAKMMSLRDYKLVGLGGNVSRVNQFIGVVFMVLVQVAIGVQWWVLRTPVLYTETVLEQVQGQLTEKTYYACDFKREDFVSYHTYVIFLVVVCCLYSISIRQDAKNAKEISTRVLIICSWFCLVLWIAIIVTLLVLDRNFLEAVCAIGLLANALAVLVIIYLPTVTAISRLKYDVAEQQAGRKENGYKLDPDFQFERPYSLPGTLHSAITDKSLTYPRSLATFDTSLSY